MKVKSLLLFFVSLIAAVSMQAQSLSNKVVASGGNFSSATWGSLSSTLGEPVITTATATGLSLTQGFQQPGNAPVGITANKLSVVSSTLYPNPASKAAWLELTLPEAASVTYHVYDMNGRDLLTGTMACDAMHTSVQKLNLESFSNGMYMVSLYTGAGLLQNFKVQILN